MVSGSSSMSCSNSGSTTGSSSCSSQGESSTNDSGRSSSSNSKQSSCSSKQTSRENSSAYTLNRSTCVPDGAVPPQQQPDQQNHQHQGKQQQQAKHQKMQQEDQQQRGQQQRRQQQQLEKEEDLSASSTWPSLSAGRSRAWGERKQFGAKGGGAGGGEGRAAGSAASEALRTRKEAYSTTAAQGVQVAGSKDSACTEAVEIVPGSGPVATAAAPPATRAAQMLEAAEEAGTPAVGVGAAEKEAVARAAAEDDGAATEATLTAAKTASTSTAPRSAAAVFPYTATAAAARPATIAATTAAGTRTAGRTLLPATALPTAAPATVFSVGACPAGKSGVCVLSSAAVEPKKARAPRRAPWCKTVLTAATQKQHIDQQQQQHEQRENHQPQQPNQQQQYCDQQLQQHQQKSQTNKDTSAEELLVDLLPSARGATLATEKETETGDAAGNAPVQTAAPDRRPLSPPTEELPAAHPRSVEKAVIACLAPGIAAEEGRGAQTTTEGLQRQQQEARVRETAAPAQGGLPQERQEKTVKPAASPQEAPPAAVSAAADTRERLCAQWTQQQHVGTGDESEGRLSCAVAQLPSGLSSEEDAALARSAADGERRATAEDAETPENAATAFTLRAAPREYADAAAGSNAVGKQHRQQQPHEEQRQPEGPAGRSRAVTVSCAMGIEAVADLDTFVRVELAAPSEEAGAVASLHGASAGVGPPLAPAGSAGAPPVREGAARTAVLSVPPAAASYTVPRMPVAEGRRTFAAAAAAALQGSADSQKGKDTVPLRHVLQNPQQRQQVQQIQSWGRARGPALPPASAAEERRSERSGPLKVAVIPRTGYLAAASAACDGPRSPPFTAAAPAVAAALRAGSLVSGSPSYVSSAASAPAHAPVAPAAVTATAGTGVTPCDKENTGHATRAATQQQRQAHAAPTRRQQEEERELVLQLQMEKEDQLQQKQHQHEENGLHELSDKEQPSEQQRKRREALSYGRLPPRSQQPRQLVTVQQPGYAQQHRQRETPDGEGGEAAVNEEEEQDEEKREKNERSPSVDRREASGTDDALSIPLTSTILADRRSVFYKTQLCPHAVRGRCRLDEQCNFAHSRRELRPPPRLDKTKICASIKAGVVCPNGQRCLFAHNREELRHSVAFYKTNMCRSWIAGACMHPHTCNHAHGMRELFFFRTLAAVAGCRDFRRERHGVAAAVAAASTPSKAASVAAALDSLRRRLAAAPPPASALPAGSTALNTAASGGKGLGEGAAGNGGADGVRGTAAGTARATAATGEKRGSCFAAASAAYAAGVTPAERGGGGPAEQSFLKGMERQRRSTCTADAGAKNSGRSSESTLTLDSISSNHRHRDGSASSSSINGGCSSTSRGSLYTSSSSGSSGSNHCVGVSSGSGGVHQQSNHSILQQRVKHVSSRRSDRQRTGQGSNATHQQQSTNRRMEQGQPTNGSSELDGNLDDLVALIPLLPDKEREFAELLLAYIEASAADKHNAASLILPIPPELTVEVGGGQASEVATPAAEGSLRGETAAGGGGLTPIAATEDCELNGAAPAYGKWTNATAAETQATTAGSRGGAANYTKKTATAGEEGSARSSGAVAASPEVEIAEERSSIGRGGAPSLGGGGTRATASAAVRCVSEAGARAPACWSSSTAAGERGGGPPGQDVQAKNRTHSTRRHLQGSERQRPAVFDIASSGPQVRQQMRQVQATRTAGAAAAAEVDFAATLVQRTGAKPDPQTQQKLHPQQPLEDQQHQEHQQQARGDLTTGSCKPDVAVKARQTGKRGGRKNGSSATPGNGLPLRVEQHVQPSHSWDTLEHQMEAATVQQVQLEEVNRLQNLLVNAAEGQNPPFAAGAAEQQQQQHEQHHQGEKHVQSQGRQFLFHSKEEVAAACKKCIQQSWAAVAAASARDEVKERGAALSVASASAAADAVADGERVDTKGEVKQAGEVLSHFVNSQLSQGVRAQQRQQLRTHRQHQQQLVSPQEQQCMEQRREQQQQQKSVPAEVGWLLSTRSDTTIKSGIAAAGSGKGLAEGGEPFTPGKETRTRPQGVDVPEPFGQDLSRETLAVCCSSDSPDLASRNSSSSAAPPAAGGVYRTTLAQQAQQPTTLPHVWQQQQQRQHQLQPRRKPSPPLHLPSTAAALLLNREVAAAGGRKHTEEQLLRQEQHQRGPGWQQQDWERVTEKHIQQQQGSVQRQPDGEHRKTEASENSSQLGMSGQARCAPSRQQQQQLQRAVVGASGGAFCEGKRRGGRAKSGVSQLLKASQLVNVSHWHHQGPHTGADAELEATLQLQPRQGHLLVRQSWQQQSEQQQFQQQRQGKTDEEQQQQAKPDGEQQRLCSKTLPFDVSSYPLLWSLYSETASSMLSPDEVRRQRQQQQREREIRAAVRACWDKDEKGKPTPQPSSSMRVPTAGKLPLYTLASSVLASPAATGTALQSADVESGPAVFSFSSPSDPTSAAAAFRIPCEAAAATGQPAAAASRTASSLRVDPLATVRCAAAVLAAAAAGAVGTSAAGGAAPPEAIRAADAAAALLERGLVESALNATAQGARIAGEDSSAGSQAPERPLQQQPVLPRTLEEGQQQASATDTCVAASLASSLVPLLSERSAVSEETGPPQALQLLGAQRLKEGESSREKDGQAAAAERREDEWLYSDNSDVKTSRQSGSNGRRSSNLGDVDSEDSVTLLQQLLLQHQALLDGSTSSRCLASAGSPHVSAAEALSTSFSTATGPSAAAVISPPAAHHMAGAPPAAAPALHVASPGAEDFCNIWNEDNAANTRALQQSANSGDEGIHEDLLLQLGCSDAWRTANTTAARRDRAGSGGGTEGWRAGSSDEDAEFAAAEAGKAAAEARNATAVPEAREVAAAAAGDGAPATGSTPGATAMREAAAAEQARDERSGLWRRRAKSFAVAGNPPATPAGCTVPAATVEGRRRATTADGGGGGPASVQAKKRPEQRGAPAMRGTAVGEENENSCDCLVGGATHTVTADDVSTIGGAAGGKAEAGAGHGAAEPLQELIPAARGEENVRISAESVRSLLPNSPFYMCSSLKGASSSSLPSSPVPAGGVYVDRGTVVQRVPFANHDEELLPIGGGAPAVTGASPAWSYSASTAAASDDYMDCRLMLLPNSSMLLDRLPAEEREGAARSKPREWKKEYQDSRGTSRATSGFIRGGDIQRGVQQELPYPPQEQHTYQERQRPQQHLQQQQQPQQQLQQQRANHYFFSELLSTETLAARSAAEDSASQTDMLLRETERSSVQQQQQQRKEGAAAPFLIDSYRALPRSSISKTSITNCVYNGSNGTRGEMGSIHVNPCNSGSSGTAKCKDDLVRQLHPRGSYVDYAFPCGGEVSSSTNRRTLNSRHSSDHSLGLYSSSSTSHNLTSSSSRSKCGSNSSSHAGEEAPTQELLHPRKLQECADVGPQVNVLNREETRELLHSNSSSDQAGEAGDTGSRDTLPDGGPLTENDMHFSAFRTLPDPLFDARQMQQFYWQQQQDLGQPQEVNEQQQKRVGSRFLGLHHQRQMDFGPQQPPAPLIGESLRLLQQSGDARGGEACVDVAAAAGGDNNTAVTTPRPEAVLPTQEGREENQHPLPQLQHARAGGRVVPIGRSNSVRPSHPVDRQERLCEGERHQQPGGTSHAAAAAELSLASPTCEPANNLDNNENGTLQSSVAMMNAVVLIERMMNALGLEN